MKGQPTPRVDALEDELRRDSEASDDFVLLCFQHLARELECELSDSLLEIDVLRRFGNKYCTAMADEELSNLRNPTTP